MLSENMFLNDDTSVYLCIIGSQLDFSPSKFSIAQQSLGGQDLLVVEASKWHSDITHLVGLLWTSDQPDTDPCVTAHNNHKKQTSMSPAIYNPQSQQVSGRTLTPQNAWPLGSAVLNHSPLPKLSYLSNLGKITSVGCVLTMYGVAVTRLCVSNSSNVK
jgi:hypothetical protein